MSTPLCFFALTGSQDLGSDVATFLGQELTAFEDRGFEDGEHKLRPLTSVRDADVYVLQSLHADAQFSVNDKLIRLLFFIGTLRDAGAKRITAIAPYLCYSRKDLRTKPRDPVSTRYVAKLFEAMGPDCVVSVDAHNIAVFENAFRCRVEHLEARNLLVDAICPHLDSNAIAVMSPDVGGTKRMHRFCEALSTRLGRDIETAFIDKKRSGGEVSGLCTVTGDVQQATVLIIDDMIVSGTTMARAASACHEQGAREVFGLATHGLFGPGSSEALRSARLEGLVVTNAAGPPLPSETLTVVDLAPMLATAVKRLHVGGSLVDLLAAR